MVHNSPKPLPTSSVMVTPSAHAGSPSAAFLVSRDLQSRALVARVPSGKPSFGLHAQFLSLLTHLIPNMSAHVPLSHSPLFAQWSMALPRAAHFPDGSPASRQNSDSSTLQSRLK